MVESLKEKLNKTIKTHRLGRNGCELFSVITCMRVS